MPRSKKSEKIKKKPETPQDLQHDHEQFLLTFEKPTQIYRFLRARQILAPTFLNRTLLYMPQRCSRTNARREKFSVNDMLTSARNNDASIMRSDDKKDNDLHISVSSLVLDPMKKDSRFLQGGRQTARLDVEVVLTRTILNKRKDIDNAYKDTSYGVSEIPVNPKPNFEGLSYIDNEDLRIVIPSSDFVRSDSVHGSTKSLVLKFRLRKIASSNVESESCDSSSSDEELDGDTDHQCKKRKIEDEEGSDDQDDPAGISLKNLQSGPRKRRSRYVASRSANNQTKDGEKSTKQEDTKSEPEKKHSYRRYNMPPTIKPNAYTDHEILAEVELVLFNQEFQCQANSGDYELVISKPGQEQVDYKRKAIWESFNGGEEVKVYESFAAPSLRFALKWVESSNYGPLADSTVEDEKKETAMFSSSERCTRKSNQDSTDADTNNDDRALFPADLVEYRKYRLGCKKNINLVADNTNNDDVNTGDRVFYQFMYNNNTQQQTESRDDFSCPWCQLNCMSLYGLMKHLKLCHPRFMFRYSQQNKGTVIVVTVNECYDGSYAGNPRNIFCQPGMAFSRRGPVRRIPVTDVLVYKPTRALSESNGTLAELLEKEDLEALEPTQMSSGHRRLYFHSLTTLPVRPCEFDIDSEDEDSEPDWLFGHTKRMIDEFTDVNEGEKALMKLWNLHVMRNSCISDSQLEEESKKFIDHNITHLVGRSLRRNLLLHFICLVDFGVLKTSNVLTLMQYFDNASNAYKISKRINGDAPTLMPADFPEPDLLPRYSKLRCLIDGEITDE